MNVGPLGLAAIVSAVIALSGCGSQATPYTASATVACLRDRVAAISQPSRAAARELRQRPQRTDVAFVVRSGTTTGTKARGGDYQIGLYPSEEILYFHFAQSNREASELLQGYRPNLEYQIDKRAAERLVYRRRNVVVEWDQRPPSLTDQQVVEQCLLTKRRALAARRKWRPAPQPKGFAGAFAQASLPLLKLIPGDAEVVRAWSIRAGGGISPQVAITWKRTSLLGGSSLDGFVIWQRVERTDVWRLIYSMRFPTYRVSFVYAKAGDVNGDRHADLLLFEDMGGSAGCGVYRLLASMHGRATQLLARRGCFDNTRLRIRLGALYMYDGLVRDPRTLQQIHCCWTTWLRTTLRWRGSKLISVATARIQPLPKPLLLNRY